MTQTTHRPSFRSHCEPNSFYSVAEDGALTFDGERMTYCPEWLVAATATHERDGSHADCVICKAKADEAADDYADMRRENAFGKGL